MVALSSSKEIQVNPRDKVNLELSFDVTEEAVDEIKAFIWESVTSITPVKVSLNNK